MPAWTYSDLVHRGAVGTALRLLNLGWDQARVIVRLGEKFPGASEADLASIVESASAGRDAATAFAALGPDEFLDPNLVPLDPNLPAGVWRFSVLIKGTHPLTGRPVRTVFLLDVPATSQVGFLLLSWQTQLQQLSDRGVPPTDPAVSGIYDQIRTRVPSVTIPPDAPISDVIREINEINPQVGPQPRQIPEFIVEFPPSIPEDSMFGGMGGEEEIYIYDIRRGVYILI
jgi:hypothetical protein